MRLYVGNLARTVTQEDLQELFSPFGAISEVVVVKDRSNDVSKGFAFVEMPSADEAKKAIAELHGKELQGRSMDVNEARPKSPSSSRGGGGGRSGGGRRW